MNVDNETIAVLEVSKMDGNNLYLPDQLDRKIYVKVNKIIEAAGGKWNRKEKAHVFKSNAAERIDDVILTKNILDVKKDLNFFPTPEEIITSMLNQADFTETSLVLEPSFGDGRIIKRMLSMPHKEITGIEINEDMAQKFASENSSHASLNIVKSDFLDIPSGSYDIIMMNPPFKTKQGIKHTLHALEMLKEGGTLVSILPSSVLYGEDKKTKEFREILKSKNAEVINLQSGTFKESGTMVETVMVIVGPH